MSSTQQQAEQCFWRAFQQCQAVSLSYKAQDAVGRLFTLKQENKMCVVLDTVQSTPPLTYVCQRLQNGRGFDGGLVFVQCGDDGTMSIPAEPIH